MDVKAKAEEIHAKIKADPNLTKEFLADPIHTIEKTVGVDLPDEQVKELLGHLKTSLGKGGEGAKEMLGKLEKAAGDKFGDILGAVEGFFDKDKK